MNDRIREIPCNKCALILDACESGKVTDEALAYGKDISDDRKKTIALIREGSGMVVLAGSAANASSYMASRYNQSLLTYGLLAGLKGGGLGKGGEIKMRPLFDFAVDFVQKIAEENNLKQTPQTIGHNDITVGKVGRDDIDMIPFEIEKPVISYININNSLPPKTDNLCISAMIEEMLYKMVQSDNNNFIYIHKNNFPNSFQLSGDYTKKQDIIELDLYITYNYSSEDFINIRHEINSKNIEDDINIMVENILTKISVSHKERKK